MCTCGRNFIGQEYCLYRVPGILRPLQFIQFIVHFQYYGRKWIIYIDLSWLNWIILKNCMVKLWISMSIYFIPAHWKVWHQNWLHCCQRFCEPCWAKNWTLPVCLSVRIPVFCPTSHVRPCLTSHSKSTACYIKACFYGGKDLRLL